jgi:hypothetical protein
VAGHGGIVARCFIQMKYCKSHVFDIFVLFFFQGEYVALRGVSKGASPLTVGVFLVK